MVILTICTPCFCQRYQLFMKPELTMNSDENSKISLFYLFHTIGPVQSTPTLVVSKGNRRFKFVDFGDFPSKMTFRSKPRPKPENECDSDSGDKISALCFLVNFYMVQSLHKMQLLFTALFLKFEKFYSNSKETQWVTSCLLLSLSLKNDSIWIQQYIQ